LPLEQAVRAIRRLQTTHGLTVRTLSLDPGAYLLSETGGLRRRVLDVVALLGGNGFPLTIVGRGVGETVLEGNLQVRRGCRVVLNNISIVNPTGPGILVSTGGKLDATNIEVTNCSGRGVAVIGSISAPASARFQDCIVSNCQGAGIFVAQSNVFIDDCSVVKNAMTGVIARAKAWVQIRGSRTVVKDNPNALSSADGAEVELIFDANDCGERPSIADSGRENRSGWGRCFSKCDGPGIRRWIPFLPTDKDQSTKSLL